ncbi:MAG: NAD(P)H-dependent oxidoreductase subunit E [Candidatus Aenigmarchaeota archaeon]|nr:NAD(P)H-dependent oxidoreductase subunit E [Candidatus Aenigmarchaeota archaeon]
MGKLDLLIKSCRNGEIELLTVLEEIVRQEGYVSFEKLDKVSRGLGMPLAKLYGVASFYAFLPTKKCGQHIIRVCGSPSCYLNKSFTLLDFLKKELGVKLGDTTTDGKFTLEKASCLGQCDKAPSMMVDGKVYTNLTEEKIRQILAGLD